MIRHGKKLTVSLISTLLVLGLAAGPVQANHDHHDANVLAPLATILVLGSLLKLNQGYEYRYSNRRYGHSGHYGHRHNHRARSYSYEGYNRKSRHVYRSDRSFKSDRGFKSKRRYQH
jgi:hypothetical protein